VPTAPEQLEHAPPVDPHFMGSVPAWHVAPSQQPVLQVEPPEQSIPHVLFLQAWPGGQSAATLQPQLPFARHRGLFAGHAAHIPPVWPQAAEVSPPTHVCVGSQQPPLHVRPPVQSVEHMLALHVFGAGQSLGCVH
jgi:hypothetical protein